MNIPNVTSAIEILQSGGYKVSEQGKDSYEIYANTFWHSKIRKKLPLVGRIYDQQFFPLNSFCGGRRQRRSLKHSKKVKRLLKLEDL